MLLKNMMREAKKGGQKGRLVVDMITNLDQSK